MPTKEEKDSQPDDQDLYGGLIRLHILHHACEEPVFGLWIIEELRRHGYNLSPGTLYPMLHGMEQKGYLESYIDPEDKRRRRMYRATSAGRAALSSAKRKVRELFGELIEEPANPPGPPQSSHQQRAKSGRRR